MKRRDRPGKRTTTIDFPTELHDQIKAIADREERDFGSQVRFVLKQWIEGEAKKGSGEKGSE